MTKVGILIIGIGAAGSVVAQKCAQNISIFEKVHLASRRIESCQNIKDKCDEITSVHALDADSVEDVTALLEKLKPFLVINMALPYQDLSIMQACLNTQTHYIDTANYEPKDEAKFCYKWQWDLHQKFYNKNICALLGSGFDPGVTNVFITYLRKHYFDEITEVEIFDCNDGDHGHAFATNFNPEINIREIIKMENILKMINGSLSKRYLNSKILHIQRLGLESPILFITKN